VVVSDLKVGRELLFALKRSDAGRIKSILFYFILFYFILFYFILFYLFYLFYFIYVLYYLFKCLFSIVIKSNLSLRSLVLCDFFLLAS